MSSNYRLLAIVLLCVKICDHVISLPLGSITLDHNQLYHQQQKQQNKHQQHTHNLTESRITLSPYTNQLIQKNVNTYVSKVSQFSIMLLVLIINANKCK